MSTEDKQGANENYSSDENNTDEFFIVFTIIKFFPQD